MTGNLIHTLFIYGNVLFDAAVNGEPFIEPPSQCDPSVRTLALLMYADHLARNIRNNQLLLLTV